MASTLVKNQKARSLCRHTVVYTDLVDMLVVVRALQGRTTKAIAAELGISKSQAQYRVLKAQRALSLAIKPVKFRSDYRGGTDGLTMKMLKATEALGLRMVRHAVVPLFAAQAAAGTAGKL